MTWFRPGDGQFTFTFNSWAADLGLLKQVQFAPMRGDMCLLARNRSKLHVDHRLLEFIRTFSARSCTNSNAGAVKLPPSRLDD